MNLRILTITFCLCFWQCNSPDNPSPSELTIQYINKLRPQLLGTWQLQQAQIDHRKQISGYSSTGITKDTILRESATLNLVPWSGDVLDERTLYLGGVLSFRAKDYPVQIKFYPKQTNTNLKGTLFIDYNYQAGLSTNTTDFKFLYAIGMIGENFDVETEFGEPTMTWKGLNRAVISANFTKNK